MNKEDSWKEDLNKAHKWSMQARILSICALLINLILLVIKIFELYP